MQQFESQISEEESNKQAIRTSGKNYGIRN
jgi:hypothetical protein